MKVLPRKKPYKCPKCTFTGRDVLDLSRHFGLSHRVIFTLMQKELGDRWELDENETNDCQVRCSPLSSISLSLSFSFLLFLFLSPSFSFSFSFSPFVQCHITLLPSHSSSTFLSLLSLSLSLSVLSHISFFLFFSLSVCSHISFFLSLYVLASLSSLLSLSLCVCTFSHLFLPFSLLLVYIFHSSLFHLFLCTFSSYSRTFPSALVTHTHAHSLFLCINLLTVTFIFNS